MNIYGEPLPPNDFIKGEVNNYSLVVHNSRIVERVANNYRFQWAGPYPLVRIEIRDQSSGTGGEVISVQGGLNETSIDVTFGRVNRGTEIDFTVTLYVEPRRPEWL